MEGEGAAGEGSGGEWRRVEWSGGVERGMPMEMDM
jgi:hypothetical protein